MGRGASDFEPTLDYQLYLETAIILYYYYPSRPLHKVPL